MARSTGWNSRVAARAQSIRPTGRSSRSGQPRARPIGSRMSGMESWATVEPSRHSTMAWTMLWGWTTTSMRSYGTPNSRWASITSRPLFMRVAELTVIIGPIAQVGWARASAGVTVARSAAERPRNGPPEAVTISRATSVGRPARRHWARPECSESTGTIWPGLARAVTSSPPTIRLSLLARASRRPASRARRVGARPTEPVMPLRTTSAPSAAASSATASGPTARRQPGGSSAARPAAWVSSTRPTAAGRSSRAWAASRSAERPAARATTRNRPGAARITSSACSPIDPVDPSSATPVGFTSPPPAGGPSGQDGRRWCGAGRRRRRCRRRGWRGRSPGPRRRRPCPGSGGPPPWTAARTRCRGSGCRG